MIAKVYLRVGKGRNGFKASASTRSNPGPLSETIEGSEREIPTMQMRLALRFDDDAFNAAEIEIPIDTSELGVAVSQEHLDV